MNSVRRLAVRTLRCSSSILNRSIPRPLNQFLTPASVTNEVNKFSSMVGVKLMSTQPRQFEVINVQDEEDFKKRVIDASSSIPVIVDFHATWCGPCKLLGPRLETILSEEEGKVVMAKVDIDENSDLAMEYGVRSVPTVVGVKNGKILNQFVGLVDDDQIRTFIDKLLVS